MWVRIPYWISIRNLRNPKEIVDPTIFVRRPSGPPDEKCSIHDFLWISQISKGNPIGNPYPHTNIPIGNKHSNRISIHFPLFFVFAGHYFGEAFSIIIIMF